MKVMFAIFGLFFMGLFGTLAAEAKDAPINYSVKEDLVITPTVCQIYADTLSLALMSYATDASLTDITGLMDKQILVYIKDNEQYLGRTMASMALGISLRIMRDQAAADGPTMANKTTIAANITEDTFISCRQDVGKTRGAYRRN
jgi:hypothetical protein